jgi:hypothetical protein
MTTGTVNRAEPGADRMALRRIGAWAAIAGAVVSVAAGTSFGGAPDGSDPAALLTYVGGLPGWAWPLVQLGFMTGAVLWIAAFAAIAEDRTPGLPRVIGRLAVAVLVAGAAVHSVDAVVSGWGLGGIAREWAAAPSAELLADAGLMLRLEDATWDGVMLLYHGVPFVLLGLAVALDRTRPRWIGWVAGLAGVCSVVAGVVAFLGGSVTPALFILSAVTVSVWMIGMGLGMLLSRR